MDKLALFTMSICVGLSIADRNVQGITGWLCSLCFCILACAEEEL